MGFLNNFDRLNNSNRSNNYDDDNQWNNNNDPWNNITPQQTQTPQGMPEDTGFTGTMFGSPNDDYLTGRYKKGGKVKKQKLADKIRGKGRNGDSILAHINPQEAMMLKQMGGSGTINPETGLPEYFFRGVRNFFRNPGKTIGKTLKNPKRTIADLIATVGTIGGAVTGNPYLAAAAGAARTGIRQDKGKRGLKDYLMEGVKHAGLASAGNFAANNLGGSAYVAPEMSWSKPLSLSGPSKGADAFSVLDKAPSANRLGVSAGDITKGAGKDFTALDIEKMPIDKLNETLARKQAAEILVPKTFTDKATDFLTRPETMTNLGTLGLGAYDSKLSRADLKKQYAREEAKEVKKEIKEERESNPEYIADKKKRYRSAMKLTPEEIAANDEYLRLLAGPQHHDLLTPNMSTLDREQVSPEEYVRTGKWFKYKEKPKYKKGGDIKGEITITEMISPNSMHHRNIPEIMKYINPTVGSRYMDGRTGGQDDKIPALLSDGEYVIDASTVADAGDGNSGKGARVFDELVTNIRKKKRGGRAKLPPKLGNILDYMR